MRDEALEPAELHTRVQVVDVGGGTGFTTLGIVKHVDAKNEPLKSARYLKGDAEDLPFPTDTFDRYVSAGREYEAITVNSCLENLGNCIEYWPDPQRGIKETYRILTIGGCLHGGPVYPAFWLSTFLYTDLGPKVEDVSKPVNRSYLSCSSMLGIIAASFYVLVPIYMWLKDQIVPKGQPI
ncbi:hypothetical protein HAX54_038483 [Datura stramonium]|uniref:Methyltransferase type 11 domain-containing protein n=1 Tax=Datura stramonium TaxID=4076 RepID=A0ABS8VMW2_DATST|nr:hypothetical protein [Datura stramonium]